MRLRTLGLVLLVPILFFGSVVFLMKGAPVLRDVALPGTSLESKLIPITKSPSIINAANLEVNKAFEEQQQISNRLKLQQQPQVPQQLTITPTRQPLPPPNQLDGAVNRLSDALSRINKPGHPNNPSPLIEPPRSEAGSGDSGGNKAVVANSIGGGSGKDEGALRGGVIDSGNGNSAVGGNTQQSGGGGGGGGASGVSTEERRDAVKNAFKHAWNSYKRLSWGQDELRPVSKGANNWMRMGLTIVDSLDTMFLMGLKDEFEEAKQWVATSLEFNVNADISFFETTIRVVGGLEAAYDLSKDRMFLLKAENLASKMMPVFNTQTGIPHTSINLVSRQSHNPSWNGGASILSEGGTVQMEYAYLSHHTNESLYYSKAKRVIVEFDKARKPDHGLYPVFINPDTGTFSRQLVTLGALGDSFYEYLLKMWILTGKSDPMYQRMYMETTRAIQQHLIQTSTPSGLTYIAEMDNGGVQGKMDHLVCFAGGMFALGAYHDVMGDDKETKEEHMRLGKEITRTCHEMYARQPTGLSPELVRFYPGSDFRSGADHYILRPEAVESFFVLYRLTGDPIYQEWGWDAFQAMEKYCRTPDGYTGIKDVTNLHHDRDDLQQSFFLAETLKYLYLLFSPTDLVPLDQYVFTTEAHPLRVFKG